MAAYNSQATIGRAIESFLAQTHPDKELIVIDGASKDDTCAVVESFASPLIRLYSEPDKGIYDALNKGISRSRGEVIGILHSNDFYAKPTVLAQVAGSMSAVALDAIYADVKYFPPGKPGRTIRHYRSNRFSPRMLRYGIMPAHPTLFLRSDVFERFGNYRLDLRIAADFEFVARVFKDGSFRSAYVPDVWVRMQSGGASTSGLRSKLRLNSEIIRSCNIHGIQTSWLAVLSKYSWKVSELFPRFGRNGG